MNKLVKPISCILFVLAFAFKSLGQQPVRMPVRRYNPNGPVPVRRYNPNNPAAGQQYGPNNPAYGQRYNPNTRIQHFNPVTRPNPGRKLEQVKESYISMRLKLSPEESREFWPLYRQYVQEQTTVRIARRINNSKDSPDGTQQIDNELKYEAELVNIRKHYRDEFLRILPPQKVSELYKSEREFNDEMLRQLSERSVRAGD